MARNINARQEVIPGPCAHLRSRGSRSPRLGTAPGTASPGPAPCPSSSFFPLLSLWPRHSSRLMEVSESAMSAVSREHSRASGLPREPGSTPVGGRYAPGLRRSRPPALGPQHPAHAPASQVAHWAPPPQQRPGGQKGEPSLHRLRQVTLQEGALRVCRAPPSTRSIPARLSP